jgi:hypothetical protein
MTLAGARKVQRREYSIEDRSNRVEFKRDRPFSSFTKLGLKIEMSVSKIRTSLVYSVQSAI